MSLKLPVIGWREWLALPELHIPAIKAKVDTGARTSALHTFFIDPYEKDGERRVRFGIHPIQKNTDIEIICDTSVIDERVVSDSGGHRESRIVIATTAECMGLAWPIELTLTNRESMKFRMLLGRTALVGKFTVDAGASFLSGRKSKRLYTKGVE